MKATCSPDQAEATALARFALISHIQELLRQPVPLKVALETVASSSTQGPLGKVARRTLEDWWYAYQWSTTIILHHPGEF